MSYQSTWDSQRDAILAAAHRVKDANPDAWEEVKVPGQKSRRFISLVAAECQRLVSPDIGCNLKRGGPDVSLDVLAMPNASGARDATSTYSGLELRDIIGGAEGPSPSIIWGDATPATIAANVPGGWIQTGVVALPPPITRILPKGEAFAALTALNAFYQAPEGLQRPGGLVRPDQSGRMVADMEAIAQWFYQLVIEGVTLDQVFAQIRNSAEYRSKHPNG